MNGRGWNQKVDKGDKQINGQGRHKNGQREGGRDRVSDVSGGDMREVGHTEGGELPQGGALGSRRPQARDWCEGESRRGTHRGIGRGLQWIGRYVT